jgi:predicted ATP-grasp superfamily ATP-dependent carboligase
MKKYHSLVSGSKKRFVDQVLKPGAHIVIEEKIDGANASFKLENGELTAFSRNNQLDETNNLRGFYQWVQKNINKDLLNEVSRISKILYTISNI